MDAFTTVLDLIDEADPGCHCVARGGQIVLQYCGEALSLSRDQACTFVQEVMLAIQEAGA